MNLFSIMLIQTSRTSSERRIILSVSQDDIADLELGMEVQLAFDAYEEESFTGAVDSISYSAARMGSTSVILLALQLLQLEPGGGKAAAGAAVVLTDLVVLAVDPLVLLLGDFHGGLGGLHGGLVLLGGGGGLRFRPAKAGAGQAEPDHPNHHRQVQDSGHGGGCCGLSVSFQVLRHLQGHRPPTSVSVTAFSIMG